MANILVAISIMAMCLSGVWLLYHVSQFNMTGISVLLVAFIASVFCVIFSMQRMFRAND